MKLGIGQSVARVEDHRLLRGRGRFTDDINLPGQLHGCVMRSPHPHARIAGVDISRALAAPGVAAVLTGADVEADGLGTLPSLARGPAALTRPDGSPIFEPARLALQPRKVSFVGDCVAFVVADTVGPGAGCGRSPRSRVRAAARGDLAPRRRWWKGAPAVWEDCPDNVCYRIRLGDAEAVEAAVSGGGPCHTRPPPDIPGVHESRWSRAPLSAATTHRTGATRFIPDRRTCMRCASGSHATCSGCRNRGCEW